MTVFVCVDDNFGMMFNNRRQSRDSGLINKMLEIANGKKLWMNSYSAKLIKNSYVYVEEDYLNKAEAGDFCFVESDSLAEYQDSIEQLILFKWNKIYPSDKKLDISTEGMTLVNSFDFKGTSHKKITCEVWSK